ncbi:MAG TPA: TolC family protein [Bacteroidia bacterium]|nr:TolC family protein [Bacteroidia bacterium]
MRKQRFVSSPRSSTLFTLLLSCTLGIVPFSANAQDKDKTLTLPKALETAASNYGLVKAKDMYTQAQQEEVKQTKRELIPSFKLHEQLDYTTANSVPGTSFPYAIVVPTSGAINSSNNYTPVYGSIGMGYVEWVPFSFGQYKARVDESKILLNLYSSDAEQERFYNRIYVTQAYLDALVATRLKNLQQKNLERNIQVQKVVGSGARSGLRPGVDSSFVNAEVARAILNVLEAEKNEAEQRRNLAQLMGIASSDFQLDTSTFFLQLPLTQVNIATDVTANPILKVFQARQNLSQAREKEIFRDYFPKISVLGVASGRGSGILYNGKYDDSFSGGVPMTRFNYGAGLACTFNILDYPRMKASQQAERFRTEAARTELEEKALDLNNDLTLANEKLRISLEQMKQVPLQYQSASDFYKQKLAMYQNGLTTIIDLSQALYNLSRAEADNAIARDAVWKALLYRVSVTGDFTGFLNSIPKK